MIQGLLPDREIKLLCSPEEWPGSPLLHPFVDHKEGHPSYGLEPYGYTLRVGNHYYRQTDAPGTLVPGRDDSGRWIKEDAEDDLYVVVYPGEVVLLESVEAFSMPDDVSGVCFGKSTYARMGLLVNATPLEPGWRGILTLEVANLNPRKSIFIAVGQGIAQVQFFRGEKPAVAYAGLYQDQLGVTLGR